MQTDASSMQIFQRCEDEPIHIPEGVQSFGYLFAVDPSSGLIAIHSDNMNELFKSWKNEEKKTFFDLLDSAVVSAEQVRSSYLKAKASKVRLPIELKFKSNLLLDSQYDEYFAVVYESTGYMIIEVEPAVSFNGKMASRQETKLYSLNTSPRFKNSGSISEMAKAIADMVRNFSGFERVLIYKFNEDQSGQVIAESKVDDIESYLGLFYPESDIPKQARELYKKNWIRITADAQSKPVRLLPTIAESGRKPLDMTSSLIRTMSPVHLEYLKNQGLRSSMSLSLYSHDNLWGLVICQHREEYYLPQDMRLEVESLAHLFSWQLYAKEEEALYANREAADRVIKEMLEQISGEKDIASIFEDNEEKLLGLMNSCGFIFKYGDLSIAIGEAPPEEVCFKLLEISALENSVEAISIDNIYDFIGEKRASGVIGGLLLPLFAEKKFYTMWFRKEHVWERRWAGNPEEKHFDANKFERLKPRKSFVVHSETVRGQSIPWSVEDKRIADLFNKVFLQHALRSQELMQSNIDILTAQDKSRNEFLATLAHELRNPLAPISSAVELIRMEDEDFTAEAADIIERQIKQLTTLIDDLMDVSRITRGRVVIKNEKLGLNEIVKNAAESVKNIFASKNQTVQFELAPGEISVFADLTRFTQVVANVLSNAGKYTQKGGLITVKSSILKKKAVLSIADNGMGIDEKYLPKIFEMFSQADPFSPKGSGGLGIGLTLSKKLIELQGGKISVQSPGLGKGSTFTITIPLMVEEAAPTATSGSANASPIASGRKILVVDDNVDSARMLELLLKKKGHQVKAVNSGIEGLNAFTSFEPEIILLDIGLPDMDGYEVCEAIRALPKGKGVTIVAQTGWGQEEHLKRSKDAGFDKHLVKPVRPADVFKIVDEAKPRS